MLENTTLPSDSAEREVVRSSVIGNGVTIMQVAAALGVTERAVYAALGRRPEVPYIRVFGVRYYAPEDVRAALVETTSPAPRGRGRPKAA